jgi:uncharacterized protein YdbL (DUF1318 family)
VAAHIETDMRCHRKNHRNRQSHMSVNTTIKVAIAAGAITLAALSVYGCFGLTRVAYTAIEKWGDSAPGPTKPAVESTTALLDFIRRPCASVDKDGHLLPDGPICELNQAIHDIRKITTASGKQVQQTGQLIDATARTMGTVGESVKGTAGHLNKTADAATGTLNAATDTLGEGKRTIAAAQPLLAQLTANGASLQATTDTLNDTLKRKAVGEMLDNLAGVTAHGNAIAIDFQQVADKARADYLRPVPWWQQPIKHAGDVFDIGAAIARHTP